MIKERRNMFCQSGKTRFSNIYSRAYHHVVSTICGRHMRCKKLTEEERKDAIDFTIGMFNHIERELIDLGVLSFPFEERAIFKIIESEVCD